MTTLEEAALLGRDEHGLEMVSTLRAEATIRSTLVNACAEPPNDERSRAGLRHLRTREASQSAGPAPADGRPFAAAGAGRPSRDAPNSPVRTVRNPSWTPRGYGCCCARCSWRPAAPTMTGMNMTA